MLDRLEHCIFTGKQWRDRCHEAWQAALSAHALCKSRTCSASADIQVVWCRSVNYALQPKALPGPGPGRGGQSRQATGRTSCSSCRRPAPALRPRSGSSSSDSLKRKDSHQVLDMLLSRSSHLRTPEQVILCFPKRFALHHALRPCLGASNIHLALVSLQKNLLKSMAWSLPSSAPQAHGWAIAEEQLVQVRALGTLVSLGANPEHSQAYF